MKLLSTLIDQWKEVPEYTDVAGQVLDESLVNILSKKFLMPTTCLNGCHLEIWEDDCPKMWRKVDSKAFYRQTRYCRRHGFARIFLVSQMALEANNINDISVIE